jgi:hypothetical protein
MRRESFPVVALALGVLLQLLLFRFGRYGSGEPALPLLTLLLISEFGLIMTGIGAYMGARGMFRTGFRPLTAVVTLGCGVLAIRFLILGLGYWPR